ncbi:MAG: hypothetical protein GY801_41825 [bacterium]|nr:hypothetical protein [bacterium]
MIPGDNLYSTNGCLFDKNRQPFFAMGGRFVANRIHSYDFHNAPNRKSAWTAIPLACLLKHYLEHRHLVGRMPVFHQPYL